MGSLTLPTTGLVYADAQILIYSVENHPIYAPLLRPLWSAVQAGSLDVVSSELVVLETLAMPLRNNDAALIDAYEQFFQQPGFRLEPITQTRRKDLFPARRSSIIARTLDGRRPGHPRKISETPSREVGAMAHAGYRPELETSVVPDDDGPTSL